MNVRTFALGVATSAIVFVTLYAALDRWTDLGWLALSISIFAAIVARQAVEWWLRDSEAAILRRDRPFSAPARRPC